MGDNGSKYRMVSWWINWRDLDWPSIDNHDQIRRRADLMQAANVNTATIFGAHFRWDFLPLWTVLHDYMATVSEELGKRGIALFDHHSATLIHRYDNVTGMRKVKMHSGPHLPFCPDRRSAEDWCFNGEKLNQWRMIDLQTGNPTWHEQYTAEQFCFANPSFISSYQAYVKRLVAETGISGLMCDDNIYFNGYRSCGCQHCLDRFRQRFGYPLPSYGDPAFWGNWNNPDWSAYVDMRFDNNAHMLESVRAVLPAPDFPLMSCCSGSSYGRCNSTAQDISHFMRGCNLVHLEMCGDTPGWKHDPKVRFHSIGHKLSSALHHRSIGAATGSACVGQGYGFTPATAEIVWAVNKFLASNCWFSTLKGRLGLPDSILSTLPDDATPVGRVFGFELRHPELFSGVPVAEAAVFFSYETRNHSLFGNLEDGYYRDFSDCLSAIQEHGISTSVVCQIPENTEHFSILVLPSALRSTEDERLRLKRFIAAGGCVIASGPCSFSPEIPSIPIPNNINISTDGFEYEQKIQPWKGESRWREIEPGFHWNSGRISDIRDSMLEHIRQNRKDLALEVIGIQGYYSCIHRNDKHRNITIHLLASDFNTEIDHKLDSMRYHRSRIHYITSAIPHNVDASVVIKCNMEVSVHTPMSESQTIIRRDGEYLNIELPPQCPYAIISFKE